MYAMIENKGIINLNRFSQIDVVKLDGTYKLVSFNEPIDCRELNPKQCLDQIAITIAKYREEIDAEYCFWHLLESMKSYKRIWFPNALYLPSKAWYTIINRFFKKGIVKPAKLLDETELKPGGLNTILIIHKTTAGKSYWQDIQEDIEDIKNALKAALEIPIDVEWEPNV
ncbi:MAG: hypothetical protein OXI43_17780 [Candidatus Poribacteria bacterium]|nr:hypothetical protein [Candidatus Poribacteria bacterium]